MRILKVVALCDSLFRNKKFIPLRRGISVASVARNMHKMVNFALIIKNK